MWNVHKATLTFRGTGLGTVEPLMPVKQVLLLPLLAQHAEDHKTEPPCRFQLAVSLFIDERITQLSSIWYVHDLLPIG